MEGWEGSCFLKGYRKRKKELTGALYGIGSCAGNGVWGFVVTADAFAFLASI